MGSSDYRPSAIDGLPARVSGAWAQEKLAYLRKYMYVFNVSMKDKWEHRVYLDLLAGAGRCVDDRTNEEFDGSPILALNCEEPFTQAIFVEGDVALAAALTTRVAGRATVIAKDCNDASVIETLRAALGYKRLGLAFVDNLGLDVPLDTLRTLTADRRVDLCITFQTGDLRRNLDRALDGEDADRWTAFFGSGWREVAETARRQNASPADTATRLLDFYGSQLNAIGYPHVVHSRRAMNNSKNVNLYRLVLAGKHERATHFFDQISKIAPSGQRTLW